MGFHFDHLSGKVVRIEDGWMTIRDNDGKNWSFHLTDFEPDVLIDELVHALFGARNTSAQKTFAALQNVNSGSVAMRRSHFRELVRPEKFYSLAALSASLCCFMLFYFRDSTGDLFSLKNGLAMLVLCAGWVFPLAILERKRFAYSRALSSYMRERIPLPVASSVQKQTELTSSDDVEII
ncbi:MAG: hypothetical protein QM780_13260 [Hyphomicrobium sp.]|uniref:hypothetical protein n=1 Tax=Hyphomicrobium sp. TaxID=82 RepID=UPI0039E5E695